MKKILFLAFVAIFLLSGCATSNDYFALLKEVENQVAETLSDDMYTIGRNAEQNAFIVQFHYPDFAEAIDAASNGDEDALGRWETLKNSAVDLGNALLYEFPNYEMSGTDSYVYVLDYDDKSIIYLSVVNGEITFDALSNVPSKWKKAYTFSSGNYTAGVDFGPGTYDLEAIRGFGNVSTDDYSLITIMSNDPDFPGYDKSYKNVDISDGVTLSVDGVTIRIILVE